MLLSIGFWLNIEWAVKFSLQQWVVLTGVAKRLRTMYHGLPEVNTKSRKALADNALVVDGQFWRRGAVSVPDSSWVVVKYCDKMSDRVRSKK
jgi:hypothetical protein